MGRYHFFQRIDRHRYHLEGKERKLEKKIRESLKGICRKTHVHVHPTHVHVFAQVSEEKKLVVNQRIRESADVAWDTEHYSIPVSSLEHTYISRLLEDMHKEVV